MLVVDASVALKWFLQEDGSEHAAALLDRTELLLAPELVVPEACNAAWKAVRLGMALPVQLEMVAAWLAMVFDELVPVRSLAEPAVAAALSLGHPVYDCFYLALAESRDAVVVTADQRLLRKLAGTRWAARVVALGDLV